MQSSEVPPDQDGFINIQLQLPMSYSRESNQADIGEGKWIWIFFISKRAIFNILFSYFKVWFEWVKN